MTRLRVSSLPPAARSSRMASICRRRPSTMAGSWWWEALPRRVTGPQLPSTPAPRFTTPRPRNSTATGAMAANRDLHTATLLADGTVLIAGGYADADYGALPNTVFASAEIYDPSSGTFSNTSPMQQARGTHFAVLLRGRNSACGRRRRRRLG